MSVSDAIKSGEEGGDTRDQQKEVQRREGACKAGRRRRRAGPRGGTGGWVGRGGAGVRPRSARGVGSRAAGSPGFSLDKIAMVVHIIDHSIGNFCMSLKR